MQCCYSITFNTLHWTPSLVAMELKASYATTQRCTHMERGVYVSNICNHMMLTSGRINGLPCPLYTSGMNRQDLAERKGYGRNGISIRTNSLKSCSICDTKGIDGDLVYRLVACNCADSQQTEFGVVACKIILINFSITCVLTMLSRFNSRRECTGLLGCTYKHRQHFRRSRVVADKRAHQIFGDRKPHQQAQLPSHRHGRDRSRARPGSFLQ